MPAAGSTDRQPTSTRNEKGAQGGAFFVGLGRDLTHDEVAATVRAIGDKLLSREQLAREPKKWITEPNWDLEPDLEALQKAHALLRDDPEKAIAALESLAAEGSRASAMYLADAYFDLPAPIHDLEKALFWQRKAAVDGRAEELHRLGRMCWDTGDWPEAFAAFSAAADQGYTPSVFRLGRCYLMGRGASVDMDKAKNLIGRAALDGHLLAKRSYARMYWSGDYGVLRIPYGFYLCALFVAELFWLAGTDHDELEQRIY